MQMSMKTGFYLFSELKTNRSRTAPQANWQYQHIRLIIMITVQMVSGFAMAMGTSLFHKGPIKHQCGLFL